MNDYKFTFYNIYTKDIQTTIISAANDFCACKEVLVFWDEYFNTPHEWVLKNMEEI